MQSEPPSPPAPRPQTYRFGTVEIDPRRQSLRVDGQDVPIEPKPFALLLALAEADGTLLDKRELLERLWPRQVVTDAVLNQCVLRARQALGAEGHRAIVTVHRKGYRLGLPVERVALAGGDDAAAVPTDAVPDVPCAARPRSRARPLLLAVALAAVVVLVFAQRREPSARDATASLAVMPIEVPDGDVEDARIAAGLGDALLTRFAQQPGLRVPARTSVNIAATHRDDVRRVGRELRVTHLLDAVLRRQGDDYVLHASLVRSDDGFQRWAGRFDIPRGGLAAAEVAVVRAVTEVLGPAPDARAANTLAVGTDSDSAYRVLLDANALRNQRTEAALRWSIERYGEALTIDPGYAEAHAGLATAWLLLYEYSNLPLRDAVERAQRHVDEALRLDPALADAHAALGLLRLDVGDPHGAEQALRRAVALQHGDATALMWLGTSLTYQGQLAEARERHAQALALDPLSAVAETYVGIDFALALDDRAADHFERALARDPRLIETYWQYALFERFRGDLAAAAARLRAALEVEPTNEYTRALLSDTLLESGDPGGAAASLGLGSDGSLAYWMETAIRVAEASGNHERAGALYRLSLDRDQTHPDDRLLALGARLALGDASGALEAADDLVSEAGGNPPFLQLWQPDLGLPRLLRWLDLLQAERGMAAAREAALDARQRLDLLEQHGVRVPMLAAARDALRRYIDTVPDASLAVGNASGEAADVESRSAPALR